jgi:HAE1 family hydrophobic/amphiphilic exporter-1
LFRQFALTIAFSISISAFNALTLSPALSAILLGKVHGEKIWLFREVDKVIAAVTHGYRVGLRGILNYKFAAVILFFAGLGATYFVYRSVPTAFVPTEDQGYFIVMVQAPPGASLSYTTGILDQVHGYLSTVPEIRSDFAVTGFSFTGSAPNVGIMFVSLKPYSQRKGIAHGATAVVNRIRGPLFMINGAMVLPFEPPAVQGVGRFGGFQYVLQDLGGHTPDQLAGVTMQMMGAAAQHKTNGRNDLAGVFSSFTANDPQFLVTIDREKAKSLQVPLQQITDALGVYMGSAYVNDFDFNNRAYRVYIQAEGKFRAAARDIREYYVRSNTGAMIPLDNLVTVTQTTTPQVISHYNLFRSAELDGSAAPGFSSGQGMVAMEDISKKVLPQGFSYEWTGLSLEELTSGRTTFLLFALGILVVYLTLSAQYESFVLPFIVLLAVPMAMLGALGAVWLRGALQGFVWHEPVTSQNDVYCQVGLVMLIGLASKNAILIVEFAEQLRERGLPLLEATLEAARIRLRPILMTSFAFILGVVPLMIATGAGSAGRHSVGTTVFGGMLMSTILNLFFIPVLYMIIEGWREKSGVKIEHR